MPRPPVPVKELHEIELLIRSYQPFLILETMELDRADVLLEHLADRLDLPYFRWTRATGLRRQGESGPIYGTEALSVALDHVAASKLEALYDFREAREAFEDRALLSRLRELHGPLCGHRGAVVFTGSGFEIPGSFAPLFTVVRLSQPSDDEYRHYLASLLEEVRGRIPVAVDLDRSEIAELIDHLRGLTLMEVRKIITKVLVVDGRLGAGDLDLIVGEKREIVERTGVLEYFPAEEDFEAIAGLDALKAWLTSRSAAFRDSQRASDFGLTPPRGVLLVGVQGCGKSLSAKAVARAWGLPLIRLDPARLYNKFVGESERNLRLAIETAARLAPIVLWIDEIEKALSPASEHDGGVSQRLFGTFLTWLQEKRQPVFVVATANDVSRLPPELLRKGRFDEIFFVDLPAGEDRREILALHLTRRGRDPSGFELDRLVDATEGFSGAEIEQAIVSSLYAAFNADTKLDTQRLLDEITRTRPISVTRAETVASLREWARERCVPA